MMRKEPHNLRTFQQTRQIASAKNVPLRNVPHYDSLTNTRPDRLKKGSEKPYTQNIAITHTSSGMPREARHTASVNGSWRCLT